MKLKFDGYTSRWDFILKRCNNKSVLHLGCVGITEGSISEKIRAMEIGLVIHPHIKKRAKRLIGIDYDFKIVKHLQKLGFSEIIYGDVTKLDQVELNDTFDVVIAGDLIEHLSSPGSMLEGVKRFMNRHSSLLITTPNAFGGLHMLRYVLGIYKEGNDHVLSFSIFTLSNLLQRHGYIVVEAWACYNRPPSTITEKIKYAIGVPFFKAIPKLGGTLCVVAHLK